MGRRAGHAWAMDDATVCCVRFITGVKSSHFSSLFTSFYSLTLFPFIYAGDDSQGFTH